MERRLLPDGRRKRLGHQLAQALRAHGLQHRGNVAGRRADVAAHECGSGVVSGFAVRGHGVCPLILVMPCTGRHTPQKGGIEYAVTSMIESRRRRVLDRPPSRTMTLWLWRHVFASYSVC